MSYLAISRKYRPATFDGIVGQPHVTRTLANAIKGDRVHHAFLFCGTRGVGKTTAARALARALNCAKGPTPTPCGECASCRDIAAGSSPDVIEIDGASNNSVDDIRDLRDTVHYAPTQGKHKIYLIDEVHMLSNAAFNALLKTLEEPPKHVIFLFATTEPGKIPDTIHSRVQRFDFRRLSTRAMTDRLRHIAQSEGVSIADDALALISKCAEGSMRDAQSLLDKVIAFGGEGTLELEAVADTLGLIDHRLLVGMLTAMVKGDAAAALDIIATVYDYGFELSRFTGDLLEIVRHATFLHISPETAKHIDLSADELDGIRQAADGADAEQLTRIFSALMETHDQVARATRPRIVLEMSVARLATVRAVRPIAGLVDRLEGLERRIRQTGGHTAPGTRPHVPPPSSSQRSGRAPRRPSRPGGDDDKPSHPAAATAARPPEAKAARPAQGASNRPPTGDPAVTDPWVGLRDALRRIGPGAARIAAGHAHLQQSRLVVTIAAGRTLSEAKRAATLPEVAAALARHYPEGTELVLRPRAGTGTASEAAEALRQEVLHDPTARRVIDALGANLVEVVRLKTGGNDGSV